MEPIFDRKGKAVAFRMRDYVYDREGKAIALVRERSLFTFAGDFLGRFEDGFYRDARSRAVAFEKGATGGPTKPVPERNVIAPLRQELPHPPEKLEVPPRPPFRSNQWSDLDWDAFIAGGATASA